MKQTSSGAPSTNQPFEKSSHSWNNKSHSRDNERFYMMIRPIRAVSVLAVVPVFLQLTVSLQSRHASVLRRSLAVYLPCNVIKRQPTKTARPAPRAPFNGQATLSPNILHIALLRADNARNDSARTELDPPARRNRPIGRDRATERQGSISESRQ